MARFGNFLALLMLALVSGISALSINRDVHDTALVSRDNAPAPADAALVPGTVYPDWDRPAPDGEIFWPRTGLQCFGPGSKCYGVDHYFFDKANDEFCRRVNGMVFSMKNLNTSASMLYKYWPQSDDWRKERGSIYMQIGFGYGSSADIAYTMTYKHCYTAMMAVIDMCDFEQLNHKHGGRLDYGPRARGNNGLFYVNDPNSAVGLADPNTANWYCTNNFWSPLQRNVNELGLVKDACYDKWCGYIPAHLDGGPPKRTESNPCGLPTDFDPCIKPKMPNFASVSSS